MRIEDEIARTILEGFDKHYSLFRAISAHARDRFARSDWAAVREAHAARIRMYDQRVRECVDVLRARFAAIPADDARWPRIKQAFIGQLYDHRQPECAETFFNSVACRVLDRQYYRNEYIFWRPAVSTEYLVGEEPCYRSHYAREGGLRETLRDVLLGFDLGCEWEDLERDLDRLVGAAEAHIGGAWESQPNFQVQVAASPFYRNKAAYLVGRARNGDRQYPFVVPVLKNEESGRVFVDALLLDRLSIGRVFSLARAYCMVDTEVPAALVTFLSSILPQRPKADLYTMIGLQKQGKTLFYRDLDQHLRHSSDRFIVADGTKGMVMVVFTLPSFPYVFKVIRDWYPPPKDTDRERVEERYQFVKMNDRVGRMADTLEYSHVAFPLDRIDPTLLEELQTLAPSVTQIDGEHLVVRHLYIERRMIPLDVYLRMASDAQAAAAIDDFGKTVREIASANIFPGDLLPKNFGVTRYGRVVFYDYDEIGKLTDFRFRRFPKPRDYDEELSAEPQFSVGPMDVFPEQFPTFLFPEGRDRDLFMEKHAALADPATWIALQKRCRAEQQEDIFPYGDAVRFAP